MSGYDAKTYASRWYDENGKPNDRCGLCHDYRAGPGDGLCKRCRKLFDDGDTNMSDSVLDYQLRISRERAADKAALEKAAAEQAKKKEG